jgi:hypothetical protein
VSDGIQPQRVIARRTRWAFGGGVIRARPAFIVTFADGHSLHHVKRRVSAAALFTLFVLGAPVVKGPALAATPASSGKTPAPLCRGRATRLLPGHISFSFSCAGEDVTAFDLRANRALHSVYDPSYAFGCERRTYRSFSCEDIHSGAGSEGFGVATVSEPLCHPGAHLVVRVTPTLDFEAQSSTPFTLRGPC